MFSVIPISKVKTVAKILKAIHSQESKAAYRNKAKDVAETIRAMRLSKAVKTIEDRMEETLTYADFPTEHWTRIRTNSIL